MARIECPECGHVEETTGLVTICPNCKADLRNVMAEMGHRRERLREVAHDDSMTTHEFIVRTKDLHKIYKMGEVEVPALKGVDVNIPSSVALGEQGQSACRAHEDGCTCCGRT